MKINNKVIELFECANLAENEPLIISNSIIKTLDFDTAEFKNKIIIENCIIHDFMILSCWFYKGLTFRNNQVLNYIDYQMGGHNEEPISIEGNIFYGFFNFFDCQFGASVTIENNIFINGSNLLGNKNEGFKNTFDSDLVEKNNVGKINLDGIGR